MSKIIIAIIFYILVLYTLYKIIYYIYEYYKPSTVYKIDGTEFYYTVNQSTNYKDLICFHHNIYTLTKHNQYDLVETLSLDDKFYNLSDNERNNIIKQINQKRLPQNYTVKPKYTDYIKYKGEYIPLFGSDGEPNTPLYDPNYVYITVTEKEELLSYKTAYQNQLTQNNELVEQNRMLSLKLVELTKYKELYLTSRKSNNINNNFH